MAAKRKKSISTPFQTLDEIFRYELAKRSSNDGLALSALSGDRKAIQDFTALAVVCVESASALPEIREWLAHILDQIASGTEPNEAFGWTQGKAGRPSARTNFRDLMKQWVIGQHVAGLMATEKPITENKAIETVASARNASKSTVRHCWLRWQGLEETPR